MEFTEEHKKKISLAMKGKIRSKEHCENISHAKKGKPIWINGRKCPWASKNLPPVKFGKDRWNWKGHTIHVGYYYLKIDNTNLPKWNGYVKRANLVWFENTGEIVKKPFCIHHKNGNKLDDSFENLSKMTQSEHKKLEQQFVKRNVDGTFLS